MSNKSRPTWLDDMPFPWSREVKVVPVQRPLPPPPKSRKAAAAEIATVLLKDVFGIYPPALDILPVGGRATICRSCGEFVSLYKDYCPCGAPVQQPKNFHSSIAYDLGHWKIRLGRDCTQSKDYNESCPTHRIARRIQPMWYDKHDLRWFTWINTVVTIIPAIYCQIYNIEPYTFQTAVFKTYRSQEITAVARNLCRHPATLATLRIADKHIGEQNR